MKRILLLALSSILMLTACVSRVEAPPEAETPPASEVVEVEPEEPPASPEPANKHAVEDAEKISETISLVAKKLENAKECDLIYTGSVAYDAETTQSVEGVEYFYVQSKYKSISDVESIWTTTFIPDGKAKEYYDSMIENKLYGSFNGELYVREHSDLTPLTMGEWDLDTLIIKLYEEDQIIVEMETKLVGEANGVQALALFNIDGEWLLSDSYFLD